jgi:ribosomal protein S18 acetylase RimI-like enzyme
VIAIEQARETDWERVRALRLAALKGAPDAFSSRFEHESIQPPEWWQERLRSPSAVTFVATKVEDAGVITVAVHNPACSEAWIHGVWVEPAHRGCGVGDALVIAAINHARGLRVSRLLLEVAETNLPAQALYLRHGFAKTGGVGSLPPPREHIVELEFALVLC